MKKNEADLAIYEQFRRAAWWSLGRLEDWPKALEGIVKGGRGGSRARKNVAGLGLSTQTTRFVGSCLCPGKIGQVESSEGPGMPQASGAVASPQI